MASIPHVQSMVGAWGHSMVTTAMLILFCMGHESGAVSTTFVYASGQGSMTTVRLMHASLRLRGGGDQIRGMKSLGGQTGNPDIDDAKDADFLQKWVSLRIFQPVYQ